MHLYQGLEILSAVLGFLVIALSVLLILGSLNLWFKLRRFYKTTAGRIKAEWSFEWAEIRTPYNFDGLFGRSVGVHRFGYSEDGFYVACIFPYGIVLRPILVPWEDVILTSVEGMGVGFVKVPELTILLPNRVYYGIRDLGKIQKTDDIAGVC
jgi:hypothetical protein